MFDLAMSFIANALNLNTAYYSIFPNLAIIAYVNEYQKVEICLILHTCM